jgi:hypothetical protein
MQTESNDSKTELYFASGAGKAFSITETGIKIREDLTFEEWRNGLKAFRWAQINLNVALADYLKFGEIKFGAERASEAVTQLEFPLADITKAVYIGSVPEGIRKHKLSPEHLVVLAKSGVKPREMERWAKTTVEHNLSPIQLKESIKLGEVVSDSVAKKNTHGIITIHGIRMEAEIWLRRLGGVNGLKALGPEEKGEIAREVSLFLEIHDAVTKE